MAGDNIRTDGLRRILRRPKVSFSLRMAPMIDMVFLLLIFFLVAVRWRPQEDFIPFRLQSAQGATVTLARPEPLRVFISVTQKGCLVDIGGVQSVEIESDSFDAGLAELMEKITSVMNEQKRYADDPVSIICAPDVKSLYWVRICNVFYGMNFTDITFPVGQWDGIEN